MSRKNILSEKLLRKIMARCIEDEDGCLIWQGAQNSRGYGSIGVSGEVLATHRVVVMITRDISLSSRDEVCHTCDKPLCQKDEHLVVADHAYNMFDSGEKQRVATRKITPDQAVQIRKEYDKGIVGMQTLATKYGVTSKAIHQIIHGKTFGYV